MRGLRCRTARTGPAEATRSASECSTLYRRFVPALTPWRMRPEPKDCPKGRPMFFLFEYTRDLLSGLATDPVAERASFTELAA